MKRAFAVLTFVTGAWAQTVPVVSVAVNQSTQAELWRGTPALINVTLIHPRFAKAGARPLAVSADPVAIVVTGSAGDILNGRVRPLTHLTGPVMLDSSTWLRLWFVIPPEESRNLPDGQYELVAVFKDFAALLHPAAMVNPMDRALQLGWLAIALRDVKSFISPPARLRVSSEPASLTKQERTGKLLSFVDYYFLNDDDSRALEAADQVLAEDPDSVKALHAKGEVLSRAGRTQEALAAIEKAITAFYKIHPNPTEPPRQFLRRAAELERILRPK